MQCGKRGIRIGMLMLCFSCGACSSSNSGTPKGGAIVDSVGPMPSVAIAVKPSNYTTGYSGKTVDVAVGSQFGAPDRSWLSAGVTLTSSAGNSVATTAAFVNETSDGFSYELTLADPIAEGWYTVLLDPPRGTSFSGGAPEQPDAIHVRSDGKYESRFRVGSRPNLLSVAACASNDFTLLPKLIVYFSEPVDIPATGAFVVSDGKASPVCSLSDSRDGFLEYICDPPMSAGTSLTVTVGGGITSVASGAPLESGSGATPVTVALPPISGNYDPCRTFREPSVPTD